MSNWAKIKMMSSEIICKNFLKDSDISSLNHMLNVRSAAVEKMNEHGCSKEAAENLQKVVEFTNDTIKRILIIH